MKLLFFAVEPKLDNNRIYEVLVGEEQSVMVNFKENPMNGAFIIQKEGKIGY